MFGSILIGAAAGAVGTVALNVTTYGDMVLRGRGSSSVPAKVAEKMTQMAGISLSGQGGSSAGGQGQQQGGQQEGGQQKAQHRRQGLGALMGYVVGIGVGALYGAVRPLTGRIPVPVAGLLLGALAMAGSDVPATKLGVTDPKQWSATSWASDIVPHLVYGLFTAGAYEALHRR